MAWKHANQTLLDCSASFLHAVTILTRNRLPFGNNVRPEWVRHESPRAHIDLDAFLALLCSISVFFYSWCFFLLYKHHFEVVLPECLPYFCGLNILNKSINHTSKETKTLVRFLRDFATPMLWELLWDMSKNTVCRRCVLVLGEHHRHQISFNSKRYFHGPTSTVFSVLFLFISEQNTMCCLKQCLPTMWTHNEHCGAWFATRNCENPDASEECVEERQTIKQNDRLQRSF